MSRQIIFHPQVAPDLRAAAAWYEIRTTGLGQSFKAEFFAVTERVAAWPLSQPLRFDSVRTAKLEHFPYLVFFVVEQEQVWVLAVQYAGRDPAILRSLMQVRNPTISP